MNNKSSLFIVIEGVDGSGKTTLIKKMKKCFDKDKEIQNRFKKIIYTNEPGSPSILSCKKLRQLGLDKKYKLNNISRILIFMANRSEHIEKLIKPSIKEGNTLVICDRYYLSTLVYQGMGIPENIKLIETIQSSISPIIPDITFIINISKDTFLKRYEKKIKQNKNDAMDDHMNEKFSHLKKLYDDSISKYDEKIVNINGDTMTTKEQIEVIKKQILFFKTFRNTCLSNENKKIGNS